MIVDRKVDELAYLGLSKLTGWMSDRLGLEDLRSASNVKRNFGDFGDQELYRSQPRACERKIPPSIFGRRTQKNGDLIAIDVDFVSIAAVATAACVSAIDNLLAEKFEL